jgi:hypothetical protein
MMLSSLSPVLLQNLAFGESQWIPTTDNASRGQSHPEAGSGEPNSNLRSAQSQGHLLRALPVGVRWADDFP